MYAREKETRKLLSVKLKRRIQDSSFEVASCVAALVSLASRAQRQRARSRELLHLLGQRARWVMRERVGEVLEDIRRQVRQGIAGALAGGVGLTVCVAAGRSPWSCCSWRVAAAVGSRAEEVSTCTQAVGRTCSSSSRNGGSLSSSRGRPSVASSCWTGAHSTADACVTTERGGLGRGSSYCACSDRQGGCGRRDGIPAPPTDDVAFFVTHIAAPVATHPASELAPRHHACHRATGLGNSGRRDSSSRGAIRPGNRIATHMRRRALLLLLLRQVVMPEVCCVRQGTQRELASEGIDRKGLSHRLIRPGLTILAKSRRRRHCLSLARLGRGRRMPFDTTGNNNPSAFSSAGRGTCSTHGDGQASAAWMALTDAGSRGAGVPGRLAGVRQRGQRGGERRGH